MLLLLLLYFVFKFVFKKKKKINQLNKMKGKIISDLTFKFDNADHISIIDLMRVLLFFFFNG